MKNILIAYSSYGGTTTEVVEAMKSQLVSMGHQVTVRTADEAAGSMDDRDLVILGSSIRGNSPHPDIKNFVRRNIETLKETATAVFIVSITITSRYERKRKNASAYPDKIAQGLRPVSKAVFAGHSGNGDDGRFANAAARLILGITPGRDYRNFDEIRAWAASLVE